MATKATTKTITTGRRHGRARSQAGATLVESAIVLPLLLLLAFGTIDFGMLFRHHHSLSSAVRAGVRVGAIAGNTPDADWLIIRSVLEGRSTISESKIRRIVVFDAAGDDGDLDEGCKTASQAGCNSYGPSHFAMDHATFMASGASSGWAPTSRRASAFGDTDHVGVWVQTEFDYITGIFGAARTVSEVAVMKIDPSGGDVLPSGVTLPDPPPNTTTAPPPTTAPPTTEPPTTTTTEPTTTTTKKKDATTTTAAPTTTTTAPTTSTTRSNPTTAPPTTAGATTTTTTKPPTTTTTQPPTTTTTKKPTTTTTTTTIPTTTTTKFQRGQG